jgi:uncharacterized damage-inducible protein DinB
MQAALATLNTAYDAVAPLIQAIPDESLDWRPGEDEFSLKQIVVHLTHANDFYLMIVEEVRAANFSIVRLHRESLGWQRMAATDAEAMQCTSVAALSECFERAYQRLLTTLMEVTKGELERPFVLYSMQPDTEPLTTTLRHRVFLTAADHLREHQAQLADTLAQWRLTHGA